MVIIHCCPYLIFIVCKLDSICRCELIRWEGQNGKKLTLNSTASSLQDSSKREEREPDQVSASDLGVRAVKKEEGRDA